MFVYRLQGPMGDDLGQVELAIPTVEPGEAITTGDGRKLQVLEAVYDLPDDSLFRAILMVEPLA